MRQIVSVCMKHAHHGSSMRCTMLHLWTLSGWALCNPTDPKSEVLSVKCMFVQRGSVICHLIPKKKRPQKHQNTSKIPSMNHQIQRQVAFKMAKIDTNTYAMKAKAARLEMVPEFFEDEDGRRFEGQSFHVFSKR